ncbi:hypothetical protein [Peribacillus sp. NJ11]
MGRFLIQFFVAVAETEKINECVKSGVESAKARGRKGGGRKAHS